MDIVLLGGALGSLFSVLQFIASPVIGKLSDVLGRRRVLLISMVIFFFLLVIVVFDGLSVSVSQILYAFCALEAFDLCLLPAFLVVVVLLLFDTMLALC